MEGQWDEAQKLGLWLVCSACTRIGWPHCWHYDQASLGTSQSGRCCDAVAAALPSLAHTTRPSAHLGPRLWHLPFDGPLLARLLHFKPVGCPHQRSSCNQDQWGCRAAPACTVGRGGCMCMGQRASSAQRSIPHHVAIQSRHTALDAHVWPLAAQWTACNPKALLAHSACWGRGSTATVTLLGAPPRARISMRR